MMTAAAFEDLRKRFSRRLYGETIDAHMLDDLDVIVAELTECREKILRLRQTDSKLIAAQLGSLSRQCRDALILIESAAKEVIET